jgi:YegS/Rv2252/BmrU family lipid kinase
MIATATLKILVNGKAGGRQKRAGADELRRMAFESGLDAEVVPTQSAEEMDSIVARLVAEGADRIGISGGDGTVSRAAQRLVHTRTALGILPQGTANNFATALRLPMDLPSALNVLKEGKVREVDLGVVNGHYFTEAAGVGLFADILAVYGPHTNNSFFRGLYAMLRVFCLMRARRINLRIDGKTHAERAVMCTIANGFRMAEGIAIAPQAKLTDGCLDVVIVGDLKRSELIPYYRAFRAQTHMSLPKVSTVQAAEVTIDSASQMIVHLDDHVDGTTPVTMRSEAGALKVLVDRL